MAKAKKKEVKIVAKNYKSVLLDTLISQKSATCQELTKKIQEEIPFLKFESPYKVKAEYVLPTLKTSQCFVDKGNDVWALSDLFLNLENHAHTVLKKGMVPLQYEQLTEEIAMKASLHPSDIPLNVESDERFVKRIVGKEEFYFLSDWEFCNDFAFALFVLNGNEGLEEEEIRKGIAAKFNKKSKKSVILLDEDPRFRSSTEGLFSCQPKLIRKFKRTEVPKTVIDAIFKQVEEKGSAIALKDIGEEYLEEPYLAALPRPRCGCAEPVAKLGCAHRAKSFALLNMSSFSKIS